MNERGKFAISQIRNHTCDSSCLEVAAGSQVSMWKPTVAPLPTTAPQPTAPPQTGGSNSSGGNCDPSNPTVFIPPYPLDLDCDEITYRRFQVVGSDPHGFDGDNDGIGCEKERGE